MAIPPTPETNHDQTAPKVSKTGLTRIRNAFFYSLEGLGAAIKLEAAFRQEVILATLLIPLAVILPVSLTQKALLIGSILIVLITELLNSAIEWVVDYVSTSRHPFAKRAKDMGSAAVLLALVNGGVIWGLVVTENWERLSEWIRN